MAQLFAKMKAFYGARWDSQFHDARTTQLGIAAWRDVLVDVTVAQVADGFRKLQSNGGEWPPSAPRFRELCKPWRAPYERHEFQQRALPQKPAPLEVGRKHMAEIRKMLDMGSRNEHP